MVGLWTYVQDGDCRCFHGVWAKSTKRVSGCLSCPGICGRRGDLEIACISDSRLLAMNNQSYPDSNRHHHEMLDLILVQWLPRTNEQSLMMEGVHNS